MDQYLKKCRLSPLFEGIERDEIDTVLQCLDYAQQRYCTGEVIWHTGHIAGEIGVVLTGSVFLQRVDYFGNRTILAVLEEGDLFGEAYATAKTAVPLPLSVTAQSDCRILFVNARKILTVCGEACGFHSVLLRNLTSIMADKNIYLSERNTHLSERSTRDKVLSYLESCRRKQGKDSFAIPFDRQGLADFLCVDRSALSAVLSKLKNDGILDYTKNHFTIHSI